MNVANVKFKTMISGSHGMWLDSSSQLCIYISQLIYLMYYNVLYGIKNLPQYIFDWYKNANSGFNLQLLTSRNEERGKVGYNTHTRDSLYDPAAQVQIRKKHCSLLIHQVLRTKIIFSSGNAYVDSKYLFKKYILSPAEVRLN